MAYKFPPYTGVGAFRWAKLSKYLAQLGHTLDVITVPWASQGANTLLEDVQHPNIRIHRIAAGYPIQWAHASMPNRITSIIRNRTLMALTYLAYWDDEAQHWRRHLLPYAQALINKQRPDVILATGAPFQPMRVALDLKRRTNVPVILDFRDPWTEDPYKPAYYSPRRYSRMLKWETQCLQEADAVVAVAKGLRDQLQGHAGICRTRFQVIHNGYDPQNAPQAAVSEPKTFTFTYIGTISHTRMQPAHALVEAIERMRQQHPITLQFIGSVHRDMVHRWQSQIQAGWLTIRGALPQPEAFKAVQNSHYAVNLNPADIPYGLSTKIYEYAMLRVPTFAVHYGGEMEELVLNNSLGYSVNLTKDSIDTTLREALEHPREFAFRIDAFAYDALARQYSDLIHSLCPSPAP